MSKYKIGEKYFITAFGEDAEEMEYLGQIEFNSTSGTSTGFKLEVFLRIRCGWHDLIATLNGKFFTRSINESVEGFAEAIAKGVKYVGKGYKSIRVWGDTFLENEEFKKQMKEFAAEDKIEEFVSKGQFYSLQSKDGEIKWCVGCHKIRQTSCCACGCGQCSSCGYRWSCCSSPIGGGGCRDGARFSTLGKFPLDFSARI